MPDCILKLKSTPNRNNHVSKTEKKKVKHNAELFFDRGDGIVTLCGSSKFFSDYAVASQHLSVRKWRVFQNNDVDCQKNDVISQLKMWVNLSQISTSQAIVVVTDDTVFLEEFTNIEIAFAKYQNIPVFYFDGKSFFFFE